MIPRASHAGDEQALELELGLVDNRRGEPIHVAGRRLSPTPVFDTYWRFAASRQAVYLARVAGQPGPWTTDLVLRQHRFTNCYRAADRVSQFAISQVCYGGDQTPDEVFFSDAAVQAVQ